MSANESLPALTKEDFASVSINHAPKDLMELVALAKVMVASGLWQDGNGKTMNANTAVAIMYLGRTLQLDPVQSLNGIHLVKGKPMLHYMVLLSKVRQHPDYDYNIIEQSAKRAEIQWLRHGKVIGSSVFTDADATRQQTQNMAKIPDTMLIARAASNGVKRFCPDVLNGVVVYVEGELQEEPEVKETKTQQLAAEMRSQLAARNAQDAEIVQDVPQSTPNPLALVASDFGLSPTATAKLTEWNPPADEARTVLGAIATTMDDISPAIEGQETWSGVQELVEL